MLTILNDPGKITGSQRLPWIDGLTLQQQIERALPGGGAGCLVHINGEPVNPSEDHRFDDVPAPTDEVRVTRRPEGFDPGTWALIISAAMTVYAYATMPRPPTAITQNESPNNSLAGQTNVARPYQAIPDVYGLRRVWPDLIQPSAVEYVNHVKRVTEWLCVSRGAGDISAVKFADTPLSDVAGSSWLIFNPATGPSAYPELNQTTVNDILECARVPDVNGQEISTVAVSEALHKTCTLTEGSGTFSLSLADGSDLATLKGLAGSGSCRLIFDVEYEETVSGETEWTRVVRDHIDAEFPVVSYSVASDVATFVFTGGAHGTVVSLVDIFATGTSSNAIGPFTLPSQAERIRWNVGFLRGLQGSVQIRAEWWKIDGSGSEVSGSRQTLDKTYTSSTYDERHYTETVTPTAGLGLYRITFRRLTGDLSNGADVAKLEDVYACRFFATKTFPGVTIIKVVTNATPQATGFRDRKFNVMWQRKVRTLTSTTLSASRNFARAMAHLWCVAGNDIAELDTTKLAAINTAHGETSALLRFDGCLDDANMSLGERMQLMAYTARCVLWRDGTHWTVTREEAQSVPELQLDYRTLAGSGDSVINYAAHLPASNDGVEVEYANEASQSERAYVRISIASGAPVVGSTPLNPKKIQLAGCVTEAQALNRAHLEARRLMYQRTSITDTALEDAGALGVGSMVRWIDPNDFAGDDGLQAGEVIAIAGANITTSEPIDWKGSTTGRILFTGTDGRYIGAPVTCQPAAGGVYLPGGVPAGVFVRNGSTRQLGSRYSFAVGLTEAEMEASGLYVLTSAQPSADRKFQVALVNYDERMFEED